MPLALHPKVIPDASKTRGNTCMTLQAPALGCNVMGHHHACRRACPGHLGQPSRRHATTPEVHTSTRPPTCQGCLILSTANNSLSRCSFHQNTKSASLLAVSRLAEVMPLVLSCISPVSYAAAASAACRNSGNHTTAQDACFNVFITVQTASCDSLQGNLRLQVTTAYLPATCTAFSPLAAAHRQPLQHHAG